MQAILLSWTQLDSAGLSWTQLNSAGLSWTQYIFWGPSIKNTDAVILAYPAALSDEAMNWYQLQLDVWGRGDEEILKSIFFIFSVKFQ